MIDPRAVLNTVWTGLGHDSEALDRVDLAGDEPVLPSSFAVSTMTLAAHGAAVMLMTSPNLPSVVPLITDPGRGKLSARTVRKDDVSNRHHANMIPRPPAVHVDFQF